jgi:sterol 3beta-glucosyltransferase
MKISMVIIGSRGDVQPCVALGLELQRRGHQAHLVTHEHFEQFVQGYGLGFTPLPGSVVKLMEMAAKPGINAFQFFQAGAEAFGAKTMEAMLENTWQGCHDADVILDEIPA